MKKFLAIVLAVLMTVSLSVVGMAGGGNDLGGIWCFQPDENPSRVYHSLDEFLEFRSSHLLPETLNVGEQVQVALYDVKEETIEGQYTITIKKYTGPTAWTSKTPNIAIVSNTGLVTAVGAGNQAIITFNNDPYYLGYRPKVIGNGSGEGGNPTPPPTPTPGGGSSDDHDAPPATENAANDDKTLDKLAAGESAEVKLTSGSAALATDTMDTLGSHGGKLTVTVDKMTVSIPGGFGKVNEPGRIYYPMDFSDNLANAADLAAPVKGDGAKTEVVKAGGDMVMPTTVTVTLKTKLTGTVNVYYYNPETRRYTLLASPVAKDGTITFATKQMGTMVLTTGTI